MCTCSRNIWRVWIQKTMNDNFKLFKVSPSSNRAKYNLFNDTSLITSQGMKNMSYFLCFSAALIANISIPSTKCWCETLVWPWFHYKMSEWMYWEQNIKNLKPWPIVIGLIRPYWWIWINIQIQSFEKCSILTPDIRKQPQTSLESL